MSEQHELQKHNDELREEYNHQERQDNICIYCGFRDSCTELSASPEGMCPLNPGCTYE